MNDVLRVCIVAHNAYGALAKIDTGYMGGIERQTSLMARWFTEHGYDVSMITWDEGQVDNTVIDGVRVFKMCHRTAGLPILRFIVPKWTSLAAAMKRADADIYYYNCGDLGLGQVVMWCRAHGRRSVYSVASDPDCDPRLPVLKPLRERILYKYGLKHVDSIVVQTQRQQQMLREGFERDSVVIHMPCTRFVQNTPADGCVSRNGTPHVLWVGRISKEKRFEWLLDIAEKCPDITFNVVGASNSDSEYASDLTKRAAGISNVQMHGRISHDDIGDYYRRCDVLCCTSVYEGFPNTFLEAWSCGVPVVATVNPDDVITTHNLGWTAPDLAGMISAIRESTRESVMRGTISEACRTYYANNHTADRCMERFAQLFDHMQDIKL